MTTTDPAQAVTEGALRVAAILGRTLRERSHGITVGPGKELYAYDKQRGVYARGEETLERMAQALLGEDFSTHRLSEALAWLRLEVPNMWALPPENVLNLTNGLLHLTPAKQLQPHSSDHFSAVQLGASFEPMARCPAIEQFVAEIMPQDAAAAFYEFVGLLLVPDTWLKRAGLFLGPRDSGKSTALMVLERFLGPSNISHVSLHGLSDNRFAPAQLVGKLANFYADLDYKVLRNPAIFKILTGQDVLQVERKYGQPFDYRPFARHIFSANKPPPTADASAAYFSRWFVFRFGRTFSRAEQDPRLLEKLTTPDELSGLLNLALEGLSRLRRQGDFTSSASALRALRQYQRDADPIASFLDETVKAEPHGVVLQGELYAYWVAWCPKHRILPQTARKFNEHLRELWGPNVRGDWKTRDAQGRTIWRGIAWKGGAR